MEKLVSHEELISSTINDAINGAQPDTIITLLFEKGFIDIRSVERFAIRKDVATLVEGGMTRCRAMEDVCYKYSCSYEKVRGLIYNSQK